MSCVELKADQTVELAETFGLLADPTRLSIVLACREHEVSTGDIAEELEISASLVSHHLRLLRAARVLRADRRGKHVFYTLADACVRNVLQIMIEHLFVHEHGETDEPQEGED